MQDRTSPTFLILTCNSLCCLYLDFNVLYDYSRCFFLVTRPISLDHACDRLRCAAQPKGNSLNSLTSFIFGLHEQRFSMAVQIDPETGCFKNIDDIRGTEYPSLANRIYLDHAGTTLYPKSLIEAFSQDLIQNLYGNPHSVSESSQLSTKCIENARIDVLRFFNASPDDFEVVFTANATAAIKIVADAFRDSNEGFWYGYHVDSHTSLIGVRELASGSQCFTDDRAMADVLDDPRERPALSLLAYPGQSNMTGRRINSDWSAKARQLRLQQGSQVYTLMDAAALASTSPMDFSNAETSPDFTTVSFYKIFGFPDLGGLIVRKEAANILRSRRYFGGGTVDSVSVNDDLWHAKKSSISASLEDGTLPFHSILALKKALEVHGKIFGSMANVAKHTKFLKTKLQLQLEKLSHRNGKPACELYVEPNVPERSDSGPTLSFNLINGQGGYISIAEFQKLAIVNNIHLRTGGLCNPGGIARWLKLRDGDLRRNYASGHRCGSENDLIDGKPTGAIRVSLGATSNIRDVDRFIEFLQEFYVDSTLEQEQDPPFEHASTLKETSFTVESLSVFPIKSCAAFKIPPGRSWRVTPEGLAWDREWCLVHQGTNVALSQKQYPRMALLFPSINLVENELRVTHNIHGTGEETLCIDLDYGKGRPRTDNRCLTTASRASSVCGETIEIEHYASEDIADFFSSALGVPCTLARSSRLEKPRQFQYKPSSVPQSSGHAIGDRPIRLSNESPILLVSRSSVNRLNEDIKNRGGAGQAVSADSFRGNIVIAEEAIAPARENPYAEEGWTDLRLGRDVNARFTVLGPCQRCQMVCVDQKNASRRREPFSTLSKTRRRDGRVWFGMHMALTSSSPCYIQVGDRVMSSA
jgi:molybdenum cofactor sulfurtransferase